MSEVPPEDTYRSLGMSYHRDKYLKANNCDPSCATHTTEKDILPHPSHP